MKFAGVILLFAAGACAPAPVGEPRGFKCGADSECEGLPCNFGICGGAVPLQTLDAGRPTLATVGPKPGTLMTSTATEAAAGARLSGMDLEGPLTITGSDVQLTDCRVRKGIVVRPGLTGVILERVWVGPFDGVALSGNPQRVISSRLEATVGIAGAIDSHVEGSLWSPPAPGTGSFVDVQGGTRTLIALNTCLSNGGTCVSGAPTDGGLRDVLVISNWLEGTGQFAVDLAAAGGTTPANVRVLSNRVDRGFVAPTGPIRVKGAARVEGNVWLDGGTI